MLKNVKQTQPIEIKSLCDDILFCAVCKRAHFRNDVEAYVYHRLVGVVCRHHPGVMEWYKGLIEKMNKELKNLGVIPNDYSLEEWEK